MKTSKPRIHKGVFYFPDFLTAREWAKKNGWPVKGIREYGLGWTVQAGPSGNHAGPERKPTLFRGLRYK